MWLLLNSVVWQPSLAVGPVVTRAQTTFSKREYVGGDDRTLKSHTFQIFLPFLYFRATFICPPSPFLLKAIRLGLELDLEDLAIWKS